MHIDRIADAHRHKQTPQQPAATTSRGRSRGLRPQANKLTATTSHGIPRVQTGCQLPTATKSYGASKGLKADATTLTATTNRGGSGGLGPPGRYCGQWRRCPKGTKHARPARGRYWDRTSDLLGVNEALSR